MSNEPTRSPKVSLPPKHIIVSIRPSTNVKDIAWHPRLGVWIPTEGADPGPAWTLIRPVGLTPLESYRRRQRIQLRIVLTALFLFVVLIVLFLTQ